MDLVQLFEMIDIDNSGAIEQNEFIRPLSRWVRDSKTAPSALIFERVQTGYGEAHDELQSRWTSLSCELLVSYRSHGVLSWTFSFGKKRICFSNQNIERYGEFSDRQGLKLFKARCTMYCMYTMYTVSSWLGGLGELIALDVSFSLGFIKYNMMRTMHKQDEPLGTHNQRHPKRVPNTLS